MMLFRLLLIGLASTLISVSSLQAQACECTNCPQFMPDLFVGDFNLNVQGATNNTLGQNGQGVCGVIVHFDHTALCDISISLTSPSGQSVVLVGPIGQFCTSNGNAGTDWDVTFVPCGSGAMPDAGFAAQWDNDQPWGGNNNYNGSYYPFGGCLQNLSGSVNGNWTLTVNDGQANDTGNLYDFEIIFCDPSGINCVSCAADAGVLPQPDVVACQGSPDLSLDLPPTYTPPAHNEPPSAEYTYAYIIGGLGGVIQAISSTPDLSALPSGNYTVCGLSYLTAHQNLVPNPNGTLTVTQLTNQLNSNTPPFCGNVGSNCVNVTILALPPDEEETVELCAPECYDFNGQFYCNTGDYTVDLEDANGCHYNGTLHLTIKNPVFKTISETICSGTCSTNPSFPGACSNGQYVITLPAANGCDSVLTLSLTVLNVDAVIQPPTAITCVQNTVPLFGAGSTLGSGTNYQWTASNGGTLNGATNLINATAASAGTYKLKVCRTIGGITCCDSATVIVTSNVILPTTPVIQGSSTICNGDTAIYWVNSGGNASSFTWVVPPGVNILSGQGDTLITVLWATASGGNICVTANNACGSSSQVCKAITVLNAPVAPTLHGPLLVCRDSLTTYSADTIAGASAINWLVTGGAILSGNGSNVIQVQWNGNAASGTVCASASNNCGQSPQTCLNININAVPAMPVVTGNGQLCVGDTGTYSIGALSGATGYTWTVPAGATIISNPDSTSIVVSWAAAPGGNVCINGVNACGAGPQVCFPVSILAQPIANAGPDTAVCATTINLAAVQSVPVSTGMWSFVSGPGSGNFSNSTAASSSVTVTLPGVYLFQWMESNGICSDADTVQVTFNESPVAGTPTPVCDGNNQNYTITFPITGGAAPYSVPGGTVSNGVFTSNSIVNGAAYMFQVTDVNGCVSAVVAGVFNCNCATNAGQMNLQPLSACPGNSVTAQASTGANFDADDVGAFVLHSGSGSVLGTIFGENTSGSFTFSAGMTFGTTYYISFVVGTNLNGLPDLMDPCLSVAPGQPVTFHDNPAPNAGADVSGCGLTLTATAAAITGNIMWSVSSAPPGGMATIASPQTAATSVTANVFGAYTLTYTVTENGCSGSDNVVLNFGNAPSAGPITHTCDGTNLFYTVNFTISGGQAPYTVSGQPVVGTMFTSAPIASGSSYNFVISDANGCMSGSVIGSFTCNCATNAGQVALTTITACQSDSITVQLLGGQNLDADDVSSFVLHTGSGPSLGTIIYENHTGKFGYWATMSFGTTYFVSAVAGNNLNGFPDPTDMCFSVSQGQPIVFIQNPVPKAGSDFVVCGLMANMPAVQSAFAGIWTQISGPGTANFSNTASPTSMVVAPISGVYVFRWTETNGMCSAFDDIEVNFLDNPMINNLTEVCNGTNTGYTLNFTANTGTGTYTITGLNGVFTGGNFSSAVLPNGSSYSFQVQDQFGCQSAVITGDHLCNCTTDAGTMNPAPLIFCADQPAVGVWNNNPTLDADDVVQFILHDQPGGTLGTVYGTNTQPSFNFAPPLLTGTTYYISAISGSMQGANINLNDPCLDIAPGTPVQWKALPFAALSGDATICNGSSTVLNINGTGTFPLLVSYNDGTGNTVQLPIPNPQTIPISVSPTLTTVYSLLSVTDGSASMCSANLNSSVTVTVNQPVDAGVATAPDVRCAGISAGIALGDLITGEDPGGSWTETSAVPSVLNAFNAANATFNPNGQAAGTYTFRYLLQVSAPCPSQSTTATVIINPTPVADAGGDQLIDCHQDSAVLGGPGTTQGANIQYSWNLAGNEIGTAAQLTTEQGGNYTLIVSNNFGCSDSDNAIVTVDKDIPFAGIIDVRQVSCFGENDGYIKLDSIVSGHPPVTFSLNGGPFEADRTYKDLGPDTYVVTLLDNNGCSWSTTPQTITEPPLMTVDLGNEIEVTFGDSVYLQANASVPISALVSLEWKPLFDTLRANTFEQQFLPLKSKYITLQLVDSNGCKASSTVLVRVQRPDQVYIPNVIKPGSSNFNDRVTVYGGHGVEVIESFRIFDRWGNQLYEAFGFPPNDPTIGWDGNYKGEQMMPGVYVYFAQVRFIDGEVVTYKGDVTIVR